MKHLIDNIGFFYSKSSIFFLQRIWKPITAFFDSWIYLGLVIWRRTIEGFKHINFVIYFVLFVVIVGMLGFSDLLYKKFVEHKLGVDIPLAKAFSIYFIAILATTSADLILNEDPNSTEARSLRMPGLAFLVLGGILTFVIQYQLTPATYELSLYGVLGALYLWWITNSSDKKYKKDISEPGLSPIGGENLNTTTEAAPANVIF